MFVQIPISTILVAILRQAIMDKLVKMAKTAIAELSNMATNMVDLDVLTIFELKLRLNFVKFPYFTTRTNLMLRMKF